MNLMHKKFAITGTNGFLGWHTRLALHSHGASYESIPVGESFDKEPTVKTLEGTEILIHLAGVNRGSDEEVSDGNRLFSDQIAEALVSCKNPPVEVVYANSIQALSGNVYGRAKDEAAKTLERVCESRGTRFRSVLLPNIFGEHGRPYYNSVIATFCHLLASGEGAPTVHQDRELTLLHAQDAADWLIGVVDESVAAQRLQTSTVADILSILEEISATYSSGDIPNISTKLRKDLFNTYRSFIAEGPVAKLPITLTKHSDHRGAFFEVVRSHGGTGQSSISTTAAGISRGDHYHRRKIERFSILSGSATIRLRKMFTDRVIEFRVDSSNPVAIDMPTGWVHNLTNVGAGTLYMHFWSDELFDPMNPDTVPEKV